MKESQRYLIEDSFSEYFKSGYALRNDGTIDAISGFSTYYKIPVKAGMLVKLESTYSVASPYSCYVTYDSSGTKLTQDLSKDVLIKVAVDGFVSLCCADRTQFVIASPNNVYETINSDTYLYNNRAIKKDGTYGEVDEFYSIYKVPVRQGDSILFSAEVITPIIDPYCVWLFTDAENNPKSYGTSSVKQKEIIAAQDGYFSCCFNKSIIGGYVDIITD